MFLNGKMKEYLMTSFLVTVVFEIIAKPPATYLVTKISNYLSCKEPQIIIPSVNWNQIPSATFCHKVEVPHWLFSSFPWADFNLFMTIFALIFTWFLIWIVFRLANFLYQFEKVKKYMQWEWRKDLYVNEFWWKLLLTFMIFAFIIFVLYPMLWAIVIAILIYWNEQNKKQNLDTNNTNNHAK